MVFVSAGGKLTGATNGGGGGVGPTGPPPNDNEVFSKSNMLSLSQFADFWRRMCVNYHDEASQFVYVVIKAAGADLQAGSSSVGTNLNRTSRLRNYVVPEEMVTLIQDVVDSHPGLGFLKEATEFHSRYVHTVS